MRTISSFHTVAVNDTAATLKLLHVTGCCCCLKAGLSHRTQSTQANLIFLFWESWSDQLCCYFLYLFTEQPNYQKFKTQKIVLWWDFTINKGGQMWILLTLPGIYHVWLCMYSKPIELLFLAEANTRTLKTKGIFGTLHLCIFRSWLHHCLISPFSVNPW